MVKVDCACIWKAQTTIFVDGLEWGVWEKESKDEKLVFCPGKMKGWIYWLLWWGRLWGGSGDGAITSSVLNMFSSVPFRHHFEIHIGCPWCLEHCQTWGWYITDIFHLMNKRIPFRFPLPPLSHHPIILPRVSSFSMADSYVWCQMSLKISWYPLTSF